MGAVGAVGHGSDHLAQLLGAHVAGGEHARHRGSAHGVGDDIASAIGFQVALQKSGVGPHADGDEHGRGGKHSLVVSLHVAQLESRHAPALARDELLGNAVPAELDVAELA